MHCIEKGNDLKREGVLSSIFRKFDSDKMKQCAGTPVVVSRATIRSFILTFDSADGTCYLFADLCHPRCGFGQMLHAKTPL